jgi:hypothetical protein
MQITCGATRWVILIGPWAVKIARIRPVQAFKRLGQYLLRGEVSNKLRKYGPRPLAGGFNYFFAGVLCNRLEYWLWKQRPQSFMAPTYFSFLGLVNIQARGLPVTPWELDQEHPFPALLREGSPMAAVELAAPVQFCRINGKILVVDYGGQETAELFLR